MKVLLIPITILVLLKLGLCYSRVAEMWDIHSLIYGYLEDDANKPLICEFASVAQINAPDGHLHTEWNCRRKNKGVRMKHDGQTYLPYFAYSNGLNGILLKCEIPQNVTLHNCTRDSILYSTCNYTCKKGSTPSNSTTSCLPKGPRHDVSVDWSNILCGSKTPPVGVEKEMFLTPILAPSSIILLVVVICLIAIKCYCDKRNKAGHNDGFELREVSRNLPLGIAETFTTTRHANSGVLSQISVTDNDAAVPLLNGPSPISVTDNDAADSLSQNSLFPSKEDIERDEKGPLLNGLSPISVTDNDAADSLSQNSLFPSKEDIERDEKGGVKCTTSVQHLLDQSEKYVKDLCLLLEYISTESEQSTIKGLAQNIFEQLNLPKRGIKVINDKPLNYEDRATPCEAFLKRFAESGITIDVLVDYFEKKEQIDHILKFHIDCSHCCELSKKKKGKYLNAG